MLGTLQPAGDANVPRGAGDQSSDHRRGRRRRFPQRLEQGRLVLRRDGEQETAGGLGIDAEDAARGGARSSAHSTSLAASRFRWVPPGTTPRAARLRAWGSTGSASKATSAATRLAASMLPRCRSSPKPVTSVAALTPTAERGPRRASVQRGHRVHRVADPALDQRVSLERGREDPGAERLGEHEHVAGAGTRVGEHAVGVDVAQDHHAEERLDRIDRVAADHRAARLGHDGRRPREHLAEQLEGELAPGPTHEVEREERRPAHRVDVTQRVRGRDGAPVARRRPRSG